MRQGNNLSSTLFNICINDLYKELKTLNVGPDIILSNPLYADDITLIDVTLQTYKLVNCVSSWWQKWHIRINAGE